MGEGKEARSYTRNRMQTSTLALPAFLVPGPVWAIDQHLRGRKKEEKEDDGEEGDDDDDDDGRGSNMSQVVNTDIGIESVHPCPVSKIRTL